MSNTILVNKVLKEIRFNTEYLNRAIKEIKTDETAFLLVICVLIGHFYELTQSYSIGQKYFDKEIFRFPVIKKMRQELYDILDIFDSTENICEKIYKMIDNNYDELLLVKDKILSSFISHLRYWYKKTLVQMGKAITLGIEDASE